MNSITSLTPQQLRKAADLKEKFDALQDQLNEILGGEITTPTEPPRPARRGRRGRRKGKLSAEGLANIPAAQKARWARRRGEAVPEAAPATGDEEPKKRKRVSAAGRRATSLASKKRWAKVRAEKEAQATKKKQVSEAKLKALAKARDARWAKVRAAKKRAGKGVGPSPANLRNGR